MIYITGDTHGDHNWQKIIYFVRSGKVNPTDLIIIAGDFGGIWNKDQKILNKYSTLNCQFAFVDGNHENFDLLYQYPEEKWNGGTVHRIRPNLVHLMRGELYTIEGKTFFTFGGATSVDKDYRLEKEKEENLYRSLYKGPNYEPYKIWWEQEQPTIEEVRHGFATLRECDHKVDYIITHTLDAVTMYKYFGYLKEDDRVNTFLEFVKNNVEFKHWFCGHFHEYKDNPTDKITVLYNQIVKLDGEIVYKAKNI